MLVPRPKTLSLFCKYSPIMISYIDVSQSTELVNTENNYLIFRIRSENISKAASEFLKINAEKTNRMRRNMQALVFENCLHL